MCWQFLRPPFQSCRKFSWPYAISVLLAETFFPRLFVCLSCYKKQLACKPGSVLEKDSRLQQASVIYLCHESPHDSSVLPSGLGGQPSSDPSCPIKEQWQSRASLHELAAPKMHSRLCHHTAGRLLPCLLTLTCRNVCIKNTRIHLIVSSVCVRIPDCNWKRQAVIFFCITQPSRTPSILGSGMPYAARTFLFHPFCRMPATDRPTVFCGGKVKDLLWNEIFFFW